MSLPWFPFYVDDFLASPKVRRMDAREVGTYLLLMLEQWQSGAVSGDPAELARLTNSTPEVVEKVLAGCFDKTARGWVNRRLQSISRDQDARQAKRSKAAKARWDRASDANAQQMDEHSICHPEPEPEPEPKEQPTTAPAAPAEVVENRPTHTLAELAEAAKVRLGLGRISRDDERRNHRLLNDWLFSSAKRQPEEIMLAIEGLSDMRDRDLVGWDAAKPGSPMTLAALVKAATLDHTGDGAVRYLYDVAIEHQRKRELVGHSRAPTPTARTKGTPMQSIESVIGRIAS